MQTIVVGVDGSAHGEAALGFAAQEAALREARLLIVYVWQLPSIITPEVVYPTGVFQRVRDEAEDVLQRAVARAAELQPQVACEGKAIEGQPAAVLLEEAQGADMIVVGSRGHGEIASLLLGSVSQQIVHHAPCPVVVVR
ncbi:MAG: universal stress protein [Thermoleophilia bacterium]